MNIILLLIPLSIAFLALGIWAFFWAVNHAQFDDLDTPALSPLAEDEAAVGHADAADGTAASADPSETSAAP